MILWQVEDYRDLLAEPVVAFSFGRLNRFDSCFARERGNDCAAQFPADVSDQIPDAGLVDLIREHQAALKQSCQLRVQPV
jgi:hypothetical protein